MPIVEQIFESPEELTLFVNSRYPIVGIDTVAEKVVVDRDLTGMLAPTDSFDIVGSTGNDGTYVVSTITFNGTATEIVVTGDITDATVDGEVQVSPVAKADIAEIVRRDNVFALFYWVP